MRYHLVRYTGILRTAGCLLLLLVACMPRLGAHPMPNSVIEIARVGDEIHLDLMLPVPELELAYGQTLTGLQEPILMQHRTALVAYIISHIRLASIGDGSPWELTLTDISEHATQSELNGLYQEIRAHLVARPPAGAPQGRFMMHNDMILHQVVTHFIVVRLVQDITKGITPEHPQELGIIQLDIQQNVVSPFRVNLGLRKPGADFWQMVRLGMRHIASGLDHLLFVLALILIAPLQASGHTWVAGSGWAYAFRRILTLVSFFTVGHAVSLAASVIFPWPEAGATIEVLIALSVLLTGLHAWRPVLPGREAVIVLILGLVHGLAFGSALAGLRMNPATLVASVAGFNMGIELMQLGLVVGCLPLVALYRHRIYPVLRYTGASMVIIAACGWLAERLSHQPNCISAPLETLSDMILTLGL